jgi:phosphoenolpyruvate synthase/pyruvate phosphate dikinase|tara:strand:- start:10 stop:327 length:318 start_codon:yes stop_codon:yes gene_type:complete
MYSFKNLSKARVLKKLNIKSAKIPYLISFTEKEFNNKNTNILNLINGTFKSKVAIRSSSSSEDQKKKSFAGYFKSFLNINPKDKNSVRLRFLLTISQYFTNKKRK